MSLSRADTQLIEDDFTEVNIIKTVEQVVGDFTQLAEQKEQSLLYVVNNPTDDALLIKGNQSLIYNMLCNVVTNAIKYSPEHSTISITLDCNHKKITVEDSGPGIAAALRERVKDRFYRTPDAMGEGSGLGLAIVNRIASIHHIDWQLNEASTGGLVVEFFLG